MKGTAYWFSFSVQAEAWTHLGGRLSRRRANRTADKYDLNPHLYIFICVDHHRRVCPPLARC